MLEVQVNHLIFRKALQELQLKHQSWGFGVLYLRMHLGLATDTDNLNQINVTYTFTFYMRHEIVKCVLGYTLLQNLIAELQDEINV